MPRRTDGHVVPLHRPAPRRGVTLGGPCGAPRRGSSTWPREGAAGARGPGPAAPSRCSGTHRRERARGDGPAGCWHQPMPRHAQTRVCTWGRGPAGCWHSGHSGHLGPTAFPERESPDVPARPADVTEPTEGARNTVGTTRKEKTTTLLRRSQVTAAGRRAVQGARCHRAPPRTPGTPPSRRSLSTYRLSSMLEHVLGCPSELCTQDCSSPCHQATVTLNHNVPWPLSASTASSTEQDSCSACVISCRRESGGCTHAACRCALKTRPDTGIGKGTRHLPPGGRFLRA